MTNPTLHCPCDRRVGTTSFDYDAPPAGETAFDLKGQNYRRSYWRCGLCGHEFSQHDLDLSGLYGGTYVEQTYGDRMRATFDRIVALPPESSDNAGRVRRVVGFAAVHFPAGHIPTLLDVGAGLGVFPYAIKQAGWPCTALDPDLGAGRHLAEVVGVRTVIGDFFAVDRVELGRFDVITLNKVIEHVEDPVAMLARAAGLLMRGGFIYVEVPDVAAGVDGPGREEYFIEHHHVFSPASLTLCGERAGLSILELERLREPSGKYTLRSFFGRDSAS
jgi:SAM-dependent methyltransferase